MPARCELGELVPGPGSTVPANLVGLEWLGFRGDAPAVSAARREGEDEIVVSATLRDHLIVLGEPLLEGARYVVRTTLGCGEFGTGSLATEFTVGPSVAASAELGLLRSADIGVGSVTASTHIGSCSLDVDADRTRIELDHTESADPWRDVMIYETWVDGARWRPTGSLAGPVGPPSGSWFGRGVDVLYTVCVDTDLIEPEGLVEGEHSVVLRARVAGETTVLTTPIARVTLDCSAYEAPDDGGVRDLGADDGPPLNDVAVENAEPAPESIVGIRWGVAGGLWCSCCSRQRSRRDAAGADQSRPLVRHPSSHASSGRASPSASSSRPSASPFPQST